MISVALGLIGAWIFIQATAGRLPQRLLSWRTLTPAEQAAAVSTPSAAAGVITDAGLGAGLGAAIGGVWVWPAKGPITGVFGEPRSGHTHQGVDVAIPTGTPVMAARAGTVSRADPPNATGGYGNLVQLEHGDGFQTRYAHLDKILVAHGQHVVAGTLVGRSGNTGDSTGPHLHFEVRRNGTAIDPRSVIGGS